MIDGNLSPVGFWTFFIVLFGGEGVRRWLMRKDLRRLSEAPFGALGIIEGWLPKSIDPELKASYMRVRSSHRAYAVFAIVAFLLFDLFS